MAARTLLQMSLALVLGVVLGWLLPARPNAPTVRGQAIAVERGSEQDVIALRLGDIEAQLSALSRELAGIATSRRVAEPQSSETVTEEPSSVSVPPASDHALAGLQEEVKSLGERMESLRQAVADGFIAARFPSLDMLRHAPAEQNVARLEQLIVADRAGAEASVKWLSQEEVLATFGRPFTILKRGSWGYKIEGQSPGNITFRFVDDYVVGLGLHYDWQEY